MNQGKFRDSYQLGAILGQGAFGEVRVCMGRAAKTKRAVKIIKKEQMNEEEKINF